MDRRDGGVPRHGHNERELFGRIFGAEPLRSRFPPRPASARVKLL
jgi:hypothetical protein